MRMANLISKVFNSKKHTINDANTEDITVILTVWRRSHVEEQINALLAQTLMPRNIWVYQCCNHISLKGCLKKYPFIHHISSTVDLKYYGRFSLANHISTKYTFIIDDDVIPSPKWVQTCANLNNKYNAIISSSGRIIPPDSFSPELKTDDSYLAKYFIGDNDNSLPRNWCDQDTVVDFGCNSWFFKTSWIKYFWSIWPCTFDTGEDMHLSATCNILASIPTIIPQQTSAETSGNLKKMYGFDEHASWKHVDFIEKRRRILEFLIKEQKWTPQLW